MRKVESVYLTKDKESPFCGKRGTDAGQAINVTALNKLQSVPWEINENILHLLHDTLKPSDEPLSAIEEKERVKAYKLRDTETTDVINYLLENGNKFYFQWKYDARGRSYSSGYHVNPQGNEYRKAMLSFANKELLTIEGRQYLKIDIANCLGYDKESWTKRILEATKVINDVFYKVIAGTKYTRNYEDMEKKIVEYSKTADSPLLLIKAMFAWKEGVIEGKPIGHNMGLDSTASGLQFLSALSGCCVTARHTNVHPMIERKYTDETQNRLDELEAELRLLN